ncbi:MAG: NUDIX domain-containing protein [Actinobacteria bacterium]|nr:NUDIX domain-containing protein [Actinomycetota bacterium]
MTGPLPELEKSLDKSKIARPAATVLLVRDRSDENRSEDGQSACNIEVFMLRRNLNSDFVGGAFVFPGGGVDESDRQDPGLEAVCSGLTDAAASDQLGLATGGLAYWVAAVRECFEEAGVLLARRDDGEMIPFADPYVVARFGEARLKVYSGDLRIAALCSAENLTIALNDIVYFSHWVTPMGPTRRFDTRFFIARMPENQEPLHDGGETIASVWISVDEALERQRSGEFEMIFPTVKNLEDVAQFGSVDELIAEVRGRSSIPMIMPQIKRDEDGGFSILVPGDDGFIEA